MSTVLIYIGYQSTIFSKRQSIIPVLIEKALNNGELMINDKGELQGSEDFFALYDGGHLVLITNNIFVQLNLFLALEERNATRAIPFLSSIFQIQFGNDWQSKLKEKIINLSHANKKFANLLVMHDRALSMLYSFAATWFNISLESQINNPASLIKKFVDKIDLLNPDYKRIHLPENFKFKTDFHEYLGKENR